MERDDSAIVATVTDRGPGIAEADLRCVFDRFFTHRPDASRGHTGLGLAIVKAIVEGYGGTIVAHNNRDGGAAFEIGCRQRERSQSAIVRARCARYASTKPSSSPSITRCTSPTS
jgi:K+-sensing histidine kinase KdpD